MIIDRWGDRSFVEDIRIISTHGGAIVIAEYPPLGLKVEGGSEREARTELMTEIWATVARIMEAEGQKKNKSLSMKKTMDDLVNKYYEEHPMKPIIKDEQMGIVLLEIEAPEGVVPEIEIVK